MKKKILFFDDEKHIAESLKRTLIDNFGYDVTLISSVEDLFSELDRYQKTDLIIMDIMIPEPSDLVQFSKVEILDMQEGLNSGVVLVKKIREDKFYKNVPVLFYTAKTNANLETLKQTAYLRKPELADDINSAIENLLE